MCNNCPTTVGNAESDGKGERPCSVKYEKLDGGRTLKFVNYSSVDVIGKDEDGTMFSYTKGRVRSVKRKASELEIPRSVTGSYLREKRRCGRYHVSYEIVRNDSNESKQDFSRGMEIELQACSGRDGTNRVSRLSASETEARLRAMPGSNRPELSQYASPISVGRGVNVRNRRNRNNSFRIWRGRRRGLDDRGSNGRRGRGPDRNPAPRRYTPRRSTMRSIPIELLEMPSGGQGTEFDAQQRDEDRDSEEDKFLNSVHDVLQMSSSLNRNCTQALFLRCAAMKNKSKKYRSIATCRCKESVDGINLNKSTMLGLTVEETRKKVRTLTLRVDSVVNRDGVVLSQTERFICSCSLQRERGSLSHSSCRHVLWIRGNTGIMATIKRILRMGFIEECDSYFGQWITVSGNNAIVNNFSEDLMLCTRMDAYTSRQLTERSRNIAKRWSALLVVDAEDKIFVSVVRSAVGSGINATRLVCDMCRNDTGSKCRHERACEREIMNNGRTAIGDGGAIVENEDGDELADTESHQNPVPPEFIADPQSVHAGDNGTPMEHGATTNSMAGNAVNSATTYCLNKLKRNLVICPAEKRMMAQFANAVEQRRSELGPLTFRDPGDCQCGGILVDGHRNRTRCRGLRGQNGIERARKVTVYTLNHFNFTIVVVDWVCGLCSYENRFKGEHHGLFTATASTVYTVELMYYWLELTCLRGHSFRSVFEGTALLQRTPGYRQRFRNGSVHLYHHNTNYESRKNANTAFREFVLTIPMDTQVVKELYSCKHCEVCLSPEDCDQLGIREEEARGLKRFKSLVIDGTVSGLLRKQGDGRPKTHGVLQMDGAILQPTKVVNNQDTQESIRLFLKTVRTGIKSVLDGKDIASQTEWVLRDGFLYMNLDVLKTATNKGRQIQAKQFLKYKALVKWYLNNGTCVCENCPNGLFQGICPLCATTRTAYQKTNGSLDTSKFLQQLFSLQILYRPRLSTGTDGRPCTVYDREDWVAFKCGPIENLAEAYHSIVELGRLCLVEPISLGFFPFHPEVQRLLPATNPSVNTAANDRASYIQGVCPEAIAFHRLAVLHLQTVMNCTHVNPGTCLACDQCMMGIESIQKAIGEQNSVLGKVVQEVLRLASRHAHFTRLCVQVSIDLVNAKLRTMQAWLNSMVNKMPANVMEYWEKYGKVNGTDEIDDDTAAHMMSSFIYPGRDVVRPSIGFTKKDVQDCTKHYSKGRADIPSFFTVQCGCRHPKIIGFILLAEPESISVAVSSVMSYFRVPPRRVWYDNACNLYDSVAMRLPWLLRWTLFVVDRFHFKGHTCSNYFNANRMNLLDEDRSVNAEVVNSLIQTSVKYIRYMRHDNIVPFLRVMFAYFNVAATVRERIGTDDLTSQDISAHFQSIHPCRCSACDLSSSLEQWDSKTVQTITTV